MVRAKPTASTQKRAKSRTLRNRYCSLAAALLYLYFNSAEVPRIGSARWPLNCSSGPAFVRSGRRDG